LTGLEVEEVLAPKRAIAEKIADCYDLTVERLLEGIEDGEHRDIAASDTLHEIEVMASEPTVVNLVNAVISGALKERASDIHLVPFERGTELRYRIDGVLHEIPPPPRHLHAAFISRIKIMAEMNIAERFIPQDGNFQIQHGGRRVDVRVGTMPTIHGESVVLRLLEKGSRIQTLVELGLDEERSASLDRLLDKPYGIFLSTGPTGSGKTTTLYSILSGIYTTERKILTLEDPVEYQLPGVTQIPVKPSRGFTFATGLRAILRQDPDVIMVGEIRDSETAEIAIRAALTGHLVFSTLHTNDAAGAVTRLVDMGVEPFLIASSLEAALAQRLVRTICTTCREPVAVDDTTRKKIETIEAADRSIELSGVQLFRGAGCAECRQTGYRGRTGLYEILVLVPELRQMVLDKRPSTEIKRAALESMQTLRQSGLAKVQQGATTIDEILRVAMGDS
ncbi:MAG: GspE/PulE family protein, partial [Planctomycetota bacterium]